MIRIAPHLLWLAFATGCFENGPLGASEGRLEPDTADTGAPAETTPDGTSPADTPAPPDVANDTAVAPDTFVPPDTIPPADTTPSDTQVADTAEVEDGRDTADTGSLRACLVQSDCAGLVAADPCNGPIRCVDYGCRPDPSAAVVCESDDPCVASSCDPATGACVSRSLCTCETPTSLACGGNATWSTNDPGVRPAFDGFGCGPQPTQSEVRLIGFSASGRVRLELNSGVASVHVLDQAACDAEAGCVAGAGWTSGDRVLYFDAAPGRAYALALEESGPDMLAMIGAQCGITTERWCADGQDDDGDGRVDCDEPECNGIDGCVRPPDTEVGLCRNGLDDDNDGRGDCADPDCDAEAACLESCEVPTGSTWCWYKQGLPNGGGKSRSTHYSCNPTPQSSKEVVFKFRPAASGAMRIGFRNSVGLNVHLLADTGRGCTPRDCLAWSDGDLYFDALADTTYYIVVDGPGAVVGNFDIEFDCDPYGTE